MLAYGIKVYLVDGDWGYICIDGRGGYELAKEESSILCFKTKSEAKDFYYENVKYGNSRGVAVDTSRTAIVEVWY